MNLLNTFSKTILNWGMSSLLIIVGIGSVLGQTTVVFDTPGPGSFIVPAGVTELTVECWGAGGAGARATSTASNRTRAGGGGGAYARSTFTVSPGSTYSYSVGQGGISSVPQNGGNSDFGSGIVVAEGGKTSPHNSTAGAAGGLAANSTGDVRFSGGSGGGGGGASCGGGGGGAAGTTGAGVAGSWTGTAGAGGANDGGSGGSGGCSNGTSGNPGTGYGGGGGGARYGAAAINGANGANGAIRITYVLPIVPVFVQQSAGQQLFFDNAYVTTTEPVFRVEAPNNGGAFNTVRFEISPTWDFSGASYTQTFSGSYANSQVDEFTCNNLSPAFPANPNTVYYVRVRYSSNGGSTWSLYSAVNSFTIKPDCDVDWYQWEDPQLASGSFAYTILNQLSVGNSGSYTYQGYISWSGYISLQQISVTTPGVLNFLSAYVTGGSGGFGTAPCGDIRLGLYDVSGNLVATTNAAPAVNAWNSLPTLTNPMLAAGTYYVGAMLSCNNMFIPMIDGSGGSYSTSGYPFASGYPASLSVPGPTSLGYNYLFYAGIDEMSNVLTSNPIYFASFLGAEAWDEVTFDVNSPGRVQVMYDNGGVRTLVPNAVLPGNQAGFTSSPIDISGLDPAVYHTLYLRAIYVSTILDVNEWKVTVTYPQSTAPTSISGAGPICFGTNATLTANGGTLQPGHQWAWFTGSCGGTQVGTGPTLTVSPSSTTTYYVGAITADGCPAGPCISGTVTLPTVGTTLAVNNDNAVCLVNSNNFVHFYHSSGRLLASINSNGQNLGNVTMTAYVDAAPALVPACDVPTRCAVYDTCHGTSLGDYTSISTN
jgi:hypothetical protein